ncbi:adenine DNA glycosylase-like [Actinia tenebrosa]|uniref:Adenine DNA glycosylase n=1 Tax=Actinia tenebrosa TaxID=6105 RepID=A0A6P8H5D3_ACTTE|nr:adenine DNA glycosylase-like [Actinia tenebrosa]
MPKRNNKRKASDSKLQSTEKQNHSHDFLAEEESSIRANLLSWYDQNKRDLPWRRYASEEDPNKRGYAVWVSEVMLQQTQVATVIDYYNRWMEKWPTLKDLAAATLEEVNECWSGLGYYSRGRRLHEGCKKILEELDGNMPTSASKLQKELPGVGRYTAGAIASIAFKEKTGVVDGNVIRVFSRLRAIGADTTTNVVIDKFWQLANSLVDGERPGDLNQALMEFGATVCTPKSPSCSNCTLNEYCRAYKQVEEYNKKSTELLNAKLNNNKLSKTFEILDIENCELCLSSEVPWDPALGVFNYPMKPKKKETKEEKFATFIVQRNNPDDEQQFLIVQRPKTGLLAGMWEFPNIELTLEAKSNTVTNDFLSEKIGLSKLDNRKEIGEVNHKFSHRYHTYIVESYVCEDTENDLVESTKLNGQASRWVTKDEFEEAAMPTAMRKILKLYEDSLKTISQAAKKRKLGNASSQVKNQRTMDSFFKPKN